MIDGLLMINLDPPYVGFIANSSECWKNLTVEELRALLTDLGVLAPGESWPPREYMVRARGQFSSGALARFGLVKLAVTRSVPKSEVPPRLVAG